MRESSSSSFLPQLLLKLMINNFHCFALLGVGLGEDDVIGLDEGDILVCHFWLMKGNKYVTCDWVIECWGTNIFEGTVT